MSLAMCVRRVRGKLTQRLGCIGENEMVVRHAEADGVVGADSVQE